MQMAKRQKYYSAHRLRFVCISRLHTSFFIWTESGQKILFHTIKIEANVTSCAIVLPARTAYGICIEFSRSFDIFACFYATMYVF